MAVGVSRAMEIIELLANQSDGLGLAEISESVDLPKSAAHRILADLIASGYARQQSPNGHYILTLKFDTLGVRHLARNGLVQLSRQLLMSLARKAGALVRLSLIEGDELRFVSQLQGAVSGLRYDPDAGTVAHLSCSASGMAWLSQLPEDDALEKIYRQGIGTSETFGPKAPKTLEEVRTLLADSRMRGWATVDETYAVGTAALAAPVIDAVSNQPVGVVSIAGPNALLTEKRCQELSTDLLSVCAELGRSAVESTQAVFA